MQRARKLRLLEFIGPVFLGVAFIFKTGYNIAFGWWLDPWLQRRANRALLDDIWANLYFLASQAKVLPAELITILPFDYASVKLLWKNVLFTITRGRGEVNVSVAPRHAPGESHQLGPVVAALDRRHLSDRDLFNDFGGAATLLRSRLEALNAAFSEHEYPHIKDRL